MLSTDDLLDEATMVDIMARGHSRIPVYRGHPHNICGLLLTKKLIILSPDQKKPVRDMCPFRLPLVVSPQDTLHAVLNLFQQGKSHLAIVADQPDLVRESMRVGKRIPANVHMMGLLTLEDVMERVICEDIADETDGDSGVAAGLERASKVFERRKFFRSIIARAKLDQAEGGGGGAGRGMRLRPHAYSVGVGGGENDEHDDGGAGPTGVDMKLDIAGEGGRGGGGSGLGSGGGGGGGGGVGGGVRKGATGRGGYARIGGNNQGQSMDMDEPDDAGSRRGTND
jgi:hypothetical protein